MNVPDQQITNDQISKIQAQYLCCVRIKRIQWEVRNSYILVQFLFWFRFFENNNVNVFLGYPNRYFLGRPKTSHR